MRTPIVAGNWKMNKLVDDAVATAQALVGELEGVSGVEVVICPTYTALHAVGKVVADTQVALGAQDSYTKESGAYTGEISPQMLADVGCTWTIIGHSERRQYFGETDEFLNEKLKFALATGLKVMFCIGETLEEREGGAMDEVLTRQVTKGLEGLSAADFENVVIAYEPIWAIGTGVTASPEQAQEAHAFVRSLVAQHFTDDIAQALRIQYGGSMKPENAAELMTKPDVDGGLIGGAALDATSFAKIIKASCSDLVA